MTAKRAQRKAVAGIPTAIPGQPVLVDIGASVELKIKKAEAVGESIEFRLSDGTRLIVRPGDYVCSPLKT